MFVDASAIVALLSDEPEAQRVSDVLGGAKDPMTSPVAVLEAALALARADKFDVSVEAAHAVVAEFLDERGIVLRNLPPPPEAMRLAIDAANRFRSGRQGLNLGDCLHYACAKHYRAPMLATAGEFGRTDLEIAR